MTEITICSGTLCYIMGGAELLVLEEKFSELSNKKVKIKASVCLGICRGENRKSAPCVIIDGELLEEATLDKIMKYLQNN